MEFSTPRFMQYLKGVDSPQPVFCPPVGTYGTFDYKVTVTNACGESTTKNVYIHSYPNADPEPFFTIENSNLSSNPDFPSLSIKTGIHTEYLTLEVLDCADNILKMSEYKNGIHYSNPGPINWNLTEFMSPCNCYKIRIRSKNFCYPEISEKILRWNRIQTPTNTTIANTLQCLNGKLFYCVGGGRYQ